MAVRWLVPVPLVVALLLASIAVAQRAGLAPSDKLGWDLPTLQRALLDASNEARLRHGLDPLSADAGLARSAQTHVEENAERGVLDHGSLDPMRDELRERVARAGVALASVGENLALSVEDGAEVIARDIVDRWLTSPAHRANLLDPDFTHVGFGAAVGAAGTFVTQHLGVRLADRTTLTARPEVREEVRWRLSVRGPVGTRAALFAGTRPLTTFVVDAAIADVALAPTDAPLDVPYELTLGVASDAGTYTVSDRAVLRPDGSWESDEEGPYGVAAIASAQRQSSMRTGVAIEVAYDAPDLPWVLLVDGEHRPDVTPRSGRLSAWLPAADAPREVAVGVLRVDGTIQVLERFTLAAGPAPDLVPGLPTRQGAVP